MTEFTIENVYNAIAAFNGPNADESTKISQWLARFQKSMEAWLIADKILTEARSHAATLFAAQTIRQKILYDFGELAANEGSCNSLRASLMNHLCTMSTKFPNSFVALVTQLAVALADLYLQVPQWNNFVGEMLQELSQQTSVLLTLITVFPEELYNRSLRIGENRRNAVEMELAAKMDVVLKALSHLCEQLPSDSALQVSVISCVASWLLNRKCPTNIVAESSLFQSILYAMRMPNCESAVVDAASTCITNALFLVEDLDTNEALARVLQTNIYQCMDAVSVLLANEEGDKLQNYMRIFCELCESLLQKIVTDPGKGFGDLRSLDMVLLLIDYFDYSLIEMSFNVWYRLSEYLYQAEDYDFDILRVVFRPYIERYIMSLYKHCRLERDMHGVLNSDSEIGQFREKAAESVKDVTFIIGSVELVKHMMSVVNTASSSSGSWDEMEAALFIVSCIIHNVVETENEVIPVLVNAIFNLPADTHVMLLNTTAQLIGNLSDWLFVNSQYIVQASQWLVLLVDRNPQLLKTVAEALERVCERGSIHLSNVFDTVYAILLNIETTISHAQEMERSSIHLIKACTHLTNDSPPAELTSRLERLCCRPVKFLSEIVSGQLSVENALKENAPDSWRRLSADPILWLDRLSAIFRVLKPWTQQMAYGEQRSNNGYINNGSNGAETPWLPICLQVWKVLSATLNHFKQSLRVAEHSCRTIRFIVRSTGSQSLVLIEELAQQVITIYDEFPHSCFLYLASIIVDEYSINSKEHVQDGLVAMMNRLAPRSFLLLRDESGLREHPDTVDDLYRLAIRFVQRLPQKFFAQPVFDLLFGGTVASVVLDHMDANRSVTKFILETIDVARCTRSTTSPELGARVAVVIDKYGAALTFAVLNASLFHLSNFLLKEMSEILHAIGLYSKEKQSEWLRLALVNLPHDSGLSATGEQLNTFRNSIIGFQKQYEVVGALRDLCKYYK